MFAGAGFVMVGVGVGVTRIGVTVDMSTSEMHIFKRKLKE